MNLVSSDEKISKTPPKSHEQFQYWPVYSLISLDFLLYFV